MNDFEIGICFNCGGQLFTRLEKNLWECSECSWILDCRTPKAKPVSKAKPKRITLRNLSAYLDYLGD